MTVPKQQEIEEDEEDEDEDVESYDSEEDVEEPLTYRQSYSAQYTKNLRHKW